MIDYHQVLQQIISGDKVQREDALKIIAEQDELAVAPLIDQFYAGVNEITGLVIIDILDAIGGFEARQLIEDVYHLDQMYKHDSWRQSALRVLQDNGWK